MSKPKKAETVMSSKCLMMHMLTQGDKQPGRRYGPRPKMATPWSGMVERVVTPMSAARREAIYRRQTGRKVRYSDERHLLLVTPEAYCELAGLTPRQRRRAWKKRDVLTRRTPQGQDIVIGSKGKEVIPA